MAVHTQSDEGRTLRNLVPLTMFPSEAFAELCTTITVEQIQDDAVFKRGDTNPDLVYLLSGSVTLQSGGLVVEVVTSESESARFALAHQIPRKIDAIANGIVRVVRLDAHTVNNPPPAVYEENQGITINEDFGEDPDDWLTALLRLPLFQDLSANNLQKILISLKTAHYGEGEEIIGQGHPVDYFYLVIKGQCLLNRKLGDETLELKLNVGDSFGEEYLVTERDSSETVKALGEVNLILLEKKHFLSEIKKPMVKFIVKEDMPDAVANGAIIMDVRSPSLFEKQNLVGSANIPLLALRTRLAEVPKDKQVIVVCAKGVTSEAAAYLLAKNKINALALKDGMGIEEPEDDENTESDLADSVDEISEIVPVSQPESVTDKLLPGLDQQLEDCLAENERLKSTLREHEETVARLQLEKADLENRNQVLNQQLERLKEILNRLTKSK